MRIRAFAIVVLVATLMALSVRWFLIEDFRIASGSMVPGLLPGDLLLVWKLSYNVRIPFSNYSLISLGRPKRSEIAAFSLPTRGTETFVKRVVALEGDTVELRDGFLVLNGVTAKVEPNGPSIFLESTHEGRSYQIHVDEPRPANYGPITVPEGHFFVVGDNRSESEDSRSWGPISLACLKGRVGLVWLSLDPRGHLRGERFPTLLR